MDSAVIRFIAVSITLASLAACARGPTPIPTAAGQPSSTDVNPITGSRGGTGSAN